MCVVLYFGKYLSGQSSDSSPGFNDAAHVLVLAGGEENHHLGYSQSLQLHGYHATVAILGAKRVHFGSHGAKEISGNIMLFLLCHDIPK